MGHRANGVRDAGDPFHCQSTLGVSVGKAMERAIYDNMADHDTRHWWYRARRRVLAGLIRRRITLPSSAQILEIGCGTGHNLGMLSEFGRVDAIEIDSASRAIAEQRLGRSIGTAPLPDLDGVPNGHYDLIALLDVLEHVEDDCAALIAIKTRLKTTGRLLLTVPAHPWMWSGHDVANHHHRRYTRAALLAVVQDAGFRIERISAFNSLLFPAAILQRMLAKITGREGSADTLPSPLINAVFERIFGLEAHLVGRVPMPPGLSFVAIISAG
jgi:SAM-dependent methyltransferase